MHQLTSLFKIIELTRSQPQTGYALSGISKYELSDLAAHHYLVTFIGWQLARAVKQKGAGIQIEKVLEFCLVHDLGELFGGDIAMPYASVNPKARQLAKAFERENQLFFSRFFGDDGKFFKKMTKEIMDAQSDEAIIAKIADYVEVTHYKAYMKMLTREDVALARDKINAVLHRLKDPIAKRVLTDFSKSWAKELPKADLLKIIRNKGA